MNWQTSKLTVDFNTNAVTVGLESSPSTQTILLSFSAPQSMSLKAKPRASRTAQTLDNASRRALLAQAKQVLIDAANSL